MSSVHLSKNAKRDLKKCEPFVRMRIIKQIEKLARGERVDLEKKKGTKNDYRLRVGDFRVIFTLESNTIRVHKIGNRKNIYK
ncbi:plasmid stabilization protein [Candidatus Pacearchaeota archaeon]|nr:plasmid stabilization protein [Candidatus Pacearchaeota archaeon]|tara:strand:+ start:176 stop:421 length:246 start_codon:yes stop_codon:yes gene_type:complete